MPVYVDQRALRNDRVTIVEKGSPHSICLLESGKVKKKFNFVSKTQNNDKIKKFQYLSSCYQV